MSSSDFNAYTSAPWVRPISAINSFRGLLRIALQPSRLRRHLFRSFSTHTHTYTHARFLSFSLSRISPFERFIVFFVVESPSETGDELVTETALV